MQSDTRSFDLTSYSGVFFNVFLPASIFVVSFNAPFSIGERDILPIASRIDCSMVVVDVERPFARRGS